MTAEELEVEAFRCVTAGYDYYKNRFNKPPRMNGLKWVQGEMYKFKNGLWGAQVFDPHLLKSEPRDKLERRIEALRHFQLDKFDDNFLEGMKAELTEAINHAKANYNWDEVPGAQEYDAELRRSKVAQERRAGRAAILRQENGENEPPPATPTRVVRPRDWRDDPGEKGRRTWEWWRSRLLDENSPFVFFKEAVRLVVVVQTSSASIERVFSQVKRILASVGDSILEDNLELRLIRRCS